MKSSLYRKQESQLDIEIGLSALNSGIYKIKFRSDCRYLLIHQITNGQNYSDFVRSLPSNVRYIESNEIGLSKVEIWQSKMQNQIIFGSWMMMLIYMMKHYLTYTV